MIDKVVIGQQLYAGHPAASGLGFALSNNNADGLFKFQGKRGIFILHLSDVYATELNLLSQEDMVFQ